MKTLIILELLHLLDFLLHLCNPSIGSIKAALEPADTDYLYFVADVDSGKVYFAKDIDGFNELVRRYIK